MPKRSLRLRSPSLSLSLSLLAARAAGAGGGTEAEADADTEDDAEGGTEGGAEAAAEAAAAFYRREFPALGEVQLLRSGRWALQSSGSRPPSPSQSPPEAVPAETPSTNTSIDEPFNSQATWCQPESVTEPCG